MFVLRQARCLFRVVEALAIEEPVSLEAQSLEVKDVSKAKEVGDESKEDQREPKNKNFIRLLLDI